MTKFLVDSVVERAVGRVADDFANSAVVPWLLFSEKFWEGGLLVRSMESVNIISSIPCSIVDDDEDASLMISRR